MTNRTPLRLHLSVLLAYGALALVFAWPLPLHLGTHLTGPPSGDTGVYIWNQWVFQHELLEETRTPYFTDRIFAHTGRANLSLHNYTTFQNLIALPLIPLLGVVATFNLIYLLMTVVTAYSAFLLVRHVSGRVAESWMAGALFAWSPLLVTRGMGHFSLVAAAPLAIFLLLLARAETRTDERLRDALALGATVWWAASTDAYYAVYCLLIAIFFLVARLISVERNTVLGRTRTVRWALDVLLLCLAGLIIAMIVSRGWAFRVFDRPVSMRSLYTPMLMFTVLVIVRVWLHYRTRIARVTMPEFWRVTQLVLRTGLVAGVLLSPVLYAAAGRIGDGAFDSSTLFWRSSPGGVDMLSFVLPNPNHPLAPGIFRQWLTPRPDAYLENVVSIPLVVCVLLVVAWARGWRPSRWWIGISASFGLLALGPFIHVGGMNTFIPGPWALLRYVPIVGMARTPGRFAVVMTLAIAVLFGLALTWLGRRSPRRRPALLTAVGAVLAFELIALPRQLHSAAVPTIYAHIAAAPDDVRVLELPFGVRDGTSSIGNFSARTQYFQTYHGKPIMGGYLSRVRRRRLIETGQHDVLGALVMLSEGKPLPRDREARLIEQAPVFAQRYRLGFVVIERGRVPESLTGLAIRAFRLRHVATDGNFELYRPQIAE